MKTTQPVLRTQRAQTTQRGISIVELLAVITILGILAVIVTPVAQVVVTREIELDMMQHLRSIRRGIDIFNESIVRCWECSESNHRRKERCMRCTSYLAGVLCRNTACPSHDSSSLRNSIFNSRSSDRCYEPACAVPLDTITCFECSANLPATDMYSGRFNVSCPTCGSDVEKYGDGGFPTSFQEMYKLNTLRIAHSYNPVTSNSEDWDIVIYKSPPLPGTNISEPELRVNGVDILSYTQNPTTLQYSVNDGYPRKSGTKGLLRNGEGYVMESWEWKSLLNEDGFFDPDKWKAYATQYKITVYDTQDIDNWRSYASLLGEFSAEAIAPIMPSIYDIHFPVSSKRNRLTLDGKKKYSDL